MTGCPGCSGEDTARKRAIIVRSIGEAQSAPDCTPPRTAISPAVHTVNVAGGEPAVRPPADPSVASISTQLSGS